MSKKHSNTSTPPNPSLTIYLDESINHGVADELRLYKNEWAVEVHRQHFPHDPGGKDASIPDTEVLKKCGENNWVLISLDDSMRRVPKNLEAAVAHNVQVFLFSSGNRKGGEYRAALIVGRHRIIKYCEKHPGPFFARIGMDGSVSALDVSFPASGSVQAQEQQSV